jgi:hypothetical protein
MKFKSIFFFLLLALTSNFLHAQSGCTNVYYLDTDSDGYGTSAVFSGETNQNYGSGQYLGSWGQTMNFPTALNNLVSFNYSITNTAAMSQCVFRFYSGANQVASIEAYPQNGETINTVYNFTTPLFNITSVVVYSYWNPAYLNSLTFHAVPSSVTACTQPLGYATNNTDCNDANASLNPGMVDICNSIDDNCDGQVDNGLLYADDDGDGYGVFPGVVTQENSTIIIGSSSIVINGANILNPTTYTPNVTSLVAFYVPTTTTYTFNWNYTTLDGSGPSYDPAYFINGQEFQLSANDGIYYQSGTITVEVTAGSIFGFGVLSTDGGEGQGILTISNFNGLSNIGTGVLACEAPAGYVVNHIDCNDNIATIHPGASEICNSADDDCDTQIDDGVSNLYYADLDGDGYGVNPGITTQGNSSVTVTPGVIVINGSNNVDFNQGGADIKGQISFVVPTTTTYTFNWNYTTTDPDGPELDPAYYVNNTLVQLTNNFGSNSQSGSVSIPVTAGSTFGFAVVSADGLAGQATLTITNFNGFSNIPVGEIGCSAPTGYVANQGDCNDNLNTIHTGATELCNTIDEDCDGVVDDGLNTFYADTDGDGYGAGAVTITCTGPAGYVLNNTDCNNNSSAIHPSAVEVCNGVDENCNGLVDDGLPLITRYLDSDGDGYGNIASPSSNCSGTFSSSYVVNSSDCNDNASAVNPAGIEVCNNIDDNCNAQVDEGVQSVFYADVDGDGFGSITETLACNAPIGFVSNNVDCNDAASAVFPGASETCNGVDDNCDGQTDEGLNTYYADLDGDGFGAGAVVLTCSPSNGFVLSNNDCDDNASAINPGAQEICNSIDDNCDTQIDEGVMTYFYSDSDADGYGLDAVSESFAPGSWILYNPNDFVLVGTSDYYIGVSNTVQFVAPTTETYSFDWAYAILDDPDQDPAYYFINDQVVQLNSEWGALYQSGSVSVTVNAGDVFGFGINSLDDEPGPVWLAITNFNHYGYMGISLGCNQPVGYAPSNNDCDNNNAGINPGATEICNGIDENCNGVVDEGVQNTYYADADLDGFGGSTTTLACAVPAGYSANNSDCDESLATVNPGASELCNGIDDNCNGQLDEGVQSTFYLDEDNDGFGTSAVFSGETAQNYGSGQYLGSWGLTVNFPTALNNLVSFNYSITNTAAMSQCIFRFYNGANLVASVESYPQNGQTISTGYNFSSPLFDITSVKVFSYWNPAYLNSLTFQSYPSSVVACVQPVGYVSSNTDCNDSNASVNPGMPEICNSVDDDCDSQSDNTIYYADADNDGYGDANATGVSVCFALNEYVVNNEDCNDVVSGIHPGSIEVCNSIDDNCDTQIDEGLVFTNYYVDTDGDGYGTGNEIFACVQPTGTAYNNTDCDDANASVYPSATEICNGIDDNCTGGIDDGLQFNNYYSDTDGDNYGSGTAQSFCTNPGVGFATQSGDCNNNNNLIKPGGVEICGNGIDEDCSGSDLACPTNGGINASVTILNIGTYNTGLQTNIMANLSNGTDSPENSGAGLDLWYKFNAQSNAVRIQLTGSNTVADDNDLSIFNVPTITGSALIPLVLENDVHPGLQGAATDGGNETLLFDGLTVGNDYLICVRNNNGSAGVVSMRLSYLRGSQTDIALYTNNTGIYTNNCQNFKAKFRSGSSGYTVNRFNTALGFSNGSVPDWTYSIPPGTNAAAANTVCQLGKLVAPNLGSANQTYYITVDAHYNLPDAFGNMTSLTGYGNLVGTLTLAPEANLTVRSSDECPYYKSLSSSLATNRSVCGVSQFNWEFTEVLPIAGMPLSVNGNLGGSRIMPVSMIPGVASGVAYNVRIRGKFADNSYTPFTVNPACIRTIGNSGMPTADNANQSSTIQINNASISIYPNPSQGETVMLAINNLDGNLQLEIADATGRVIQRENINSDGAVNKMIDFDSSLSNGMYHVIISNGHVTKTLKFVVSK